MKTRTTLINDLTGGNSFTPAKGVSAFILTLLIVFANNANASTYYLSSKGSQAAQIASGWNTLANGKGMSAVNFSTSGDQFIIPTGMSAMTTADWIFGNSEQASNLALIIEGTLTIKAGSVLVLAQTGPGTNSMIVKGQLVFEKSALAPVQLIGSIAGIGMASDNTVMLASASDLNMPNVSDIMRLSYSSINTTNLTASVQSPGKIAKRSPDPGPKPSTASTVKCERKNAAGRTVGFW